jgi:hypothetical protein
MSPIPRPRVETALHRALPLLLTASLAMACSEEPPAAPGGRVENGELGLALAELPAGCSVQRNEGRELVLACGSRRGTTGEVLFQVGAEPGGVDLPALARGQKEAFEAMPEGKFFGNRELVTPSGPAYTARGRYLEDGKALEEIRILALHPATQKLLVVRSRYPEGDETAKRMEQILAIVGEVEAAGGGSPTDPAAGS